MMEKNEKSVVIKTADQLDDSPIEWFVPGWIPKHGITFLCADGGTGKTFVWTSLLSSFSKGESSFLRYDETVTTEKNVLCFSGEDTENILRKRFESAGAKLENIYVVAEDSEQLEDITFNDPRLEKAIETIRPAIVVFDPLQSFIGKDVDMSRRNQMRPALSPLVRLSSKYNMPILIIMHTNKRDESGRNKMADSADIWDIARSVIMCGFDSDKNRYISLEKSNYSDHVNTPTILFNLNGGKVNFLETTDRKMKDFVQEERIEKKSQKESEKPTKKNECINAIISILVKHNGTISSDELSAELREEFSESVIKTSKTHLRENGIIDYQRLSTGKVNVKRTEKQI